jgi:fluoride exporter
MVMIGGALGAALRYGLSSQISNQMLFIKNPGILIANGLGCLCLGIFQNSAFANQPVKHLVSIGFLGALTTFSTFIAEFFSINTKDNFYVAILFIILHIGLGIFAYKIGLTIGKTIFYG